MVPSSSISVWYFHLVELNYIEVASYPIMYLILAYDVIEQYAVMRYFSLASSHKFVFTSFLIRVDSFPFVYLFEENSE